LPLEKSQNTPTKRKAISEQVSEQMLEEFEIEEIVSSPDKTIAKDEGKAPVEQVSK